MRVLVIFNPRAGRGKRSPTEAQLRAAFHAVDLEPEFAPTLHPGHATTLVRERGATHDTVIAVGGDGTLHEVVQGLKLDAHRLGVIPVGTGNDFAWMNSIPSGLEAAVARIARNEERRIDLGAWNGGRFHNNLGLGFEAEVNRVSHRITRLRGAAVYFAALGWSLLRLRTTPARIAWSEGAFDRELLTASITVGRRVGGAFVLAPAARNDDGLLDLVAAEAMGRLRILRVLPPVLRGGRPKSDRLTFAAAAAFAVTAPEGLPVYADGEFAGSGHRELSIHVLPGALRLL